MFIFQRDNIQIHKISVHFAETRGRIPARSCQNLTISGYNFEMRKKGIKKWKCKNSILYLYTLWSFVIFRQRM